MLLPSAVAECRERGDGIVPWRSGLSQAILPTCRVCTSLKERFSSPPPKTYRCIPMSVIECPFRGDGGVPKRCGCAHVRAKSSGSSSLPPLPKTRFCPAMTSNFSAKEIGLFPGSASRMLLSPSACTWPY
jgi:hypothetical protein